MRYVRYLVVFAVMFAAALFIDVGTNWPITGREAVEAAVVAAVLTALVACLHCYVEKRRRR